MPRVVKIAAAVGPAQGVGVPPAGAAAVGAAPPISVDDRYLYGSYALVAAGAFLGCILLRLVDPSTTIAPADGFTALAPFYILAQSVERLVEPLTNLDAFGKAADGGNGDGGGSKDGAGQGAAGGQADVVGHVVANDALALTKKAAVAARDAACNRRHRREGGRRRAGAGAGRSDPTEPGTSRVGDRVVPRHGRVWPVRAATDRPHRHARRQVRRRRHHRPRSRVGNEAASRPDQQYPEGKGRQGGSAGDDLSGRTRLVPLDHRPQPRSTLP
jgi:hypothetical protein